MFRSTVRVLLASRSTCSPVLLRSTKAGKFLLCNTKRGYAMATQRQSQQPRVVVITGCSSGIGLATANLLAKDRERRFIVYGSIIGSLDEEQLFRDTAGGALNDTLFPFKLDVTKDEDVEEAVAMVMEQRGRIDILVNNAGICTKKALETISMSDIVRLYDVNLLGYVRMMRAVLPIMKKQESGRIINLSSRNAIEGAPYMNIYTSAKFGIEGLSEETAVIGRFFNIWVSLIQPGGVITPMGETMIAKDLGGAGSKGISDHPDVHEIDRKLSRYRDHDLEWSKCPSITADDVAKVVLRAATDVKPHFRYQTQEAVEALAERKYRDPSGDEFIDYLADRLRPFYGKAGDEKC
ncbi:retinol dehydrogenase 8-like [Lytechinus variegatus]|uniref:retinol dehydrogenase 8-like n=1 Tax=Lytechinus variegatus TaxID=7654 RepID=UPI001BB1FF48|nr:retinol dehydrogenase 8-like [Lytechinus variegatus]